LDLLVNAAAHFSAAIEQQLVIVQNDPAPADFAEKTVGYAEAKVAYFAALRDEMPELMINNASGKEPRLLQLDGVCGSIEKNRKRRQTKRHWYCYSDSRAILTLRRRGQNSSVLKKSKRPFTRISMGSTF
jgi:hypothetical protein